MALVTFTKDGAVTRADESLTAFMEARGYSASPADPATPTTVNPEEQA